MAIKIVTDSTSDITLEESKKIGIDVMPLNIYFGNDHYLDGVNIDSNTFFEKLKHAKESPKTSQVNADVFEKNFEKHLSNGDQVIGIFISSDLSGTLQSSKIAKDLLENDNITVIDSRTTSLGLKALVYRAVELREKGKSYDEIIKSIEDFKNQVILYAVVEDLTYLKRGGRLSSPAAAIGGILGVKPILTSEGGLITVKEKVRGNNAAYKKLVDLVIHSNVFNYSYVILGHGNNKEKYEEVKQILNQKCPELNIIESNIGPTVGLYAGPLCVGLAFIKD
ncbi:MAG: DegV family protein [Oscillospiraceae bacterium]